MRCLAVLHLLGSVAHKTLLIHEGRVKIWSAKKGLRNELGRQLKARYAA